uniref:Putative secreted protein n=2 Tax=Ixodes ricinus TaxID=34613 RepID=V5IBB5_IXORI
MMFSLSKMELVLFTVVLILPALQSGALLSGTGTLDCAQLIILGGMTECDREGYDYFDDYDTSCKLKCNGDGRLPMPKGVCYGGKVYCTPQVKNILLTWTNDVENRKNKIIKKWCGSKGK